MMFNVHVRTTMKIGMSFKHIFIVLLMPACCGAGAAQTLSTEITVDRTADTGIAAAMPLLSVQPVTAAPEPLANTLAPADYGGDAGFRFLPASFQPQAYYGLPQPAAWRGYVSAGYFPAYNAGIQAGYRLLDNERTLLRATAHFGGSAYSNGKGFGGGDVSCNAGGAALDWRQSIGAHTLHAYAGFGIAALENPNMQAASVKQNYTSLRAGIALDRRGSDFKYGLVARIDRFAAGKDLNMPAVAATTQYAPAGDTHFTFRLHGSKDFAGGLAARLALGAQLINRSGSSVDIIASPGMNGAIDYDVQAGSISHRNSGIYTVAPALTYLGRQVRARIGVRVDLASGTDIGKFNIAPDVRLSWMPTPATDVYLNVGGGASFNTLRGRFDYTPYAPAWSVEALQRVPLRAIAGFSYGRGTGFRAGFEACFQRTLGCVMPYVADFGSGQANVAEAVIFAARNMKGIWFQLRAGYAAPSLAGLEVDVSARLTINSKPSLDPYVSEDYDCWGTPDNPDRAQLIVNACAALRPLERLKLELDWEFRSDRKCLYSDLWSRQLYSLGTASELRLKGIYSLTERLALGLRLNNLLCRRYQIVPGVQSPSIHGLASVTYRF